MPDFIPAPGSTVTSAPSPCIFLTVSGVAATRPSSGSLSRATAMRIPPSPGAGRSVRASATGREPKCNQRHHHHHQARRPSALGKALDGDPGREQNDRKSNQPMSVDGANRETDNDVGDVCAADEREMDETIICFLVRRQIIALGDRIFDLSVLSHSCLQYPS